MEENNNDPKILPPSKEKMEQAEQLARDSVGNKSLGSLRAAPGGNQLSGLPKQIAAQGLGKIATSAATAAGGKAGDLAQTVLAATKPGVAGFAAKIKLILILVAAFLVLSFLLLATIAGSGSSIVLGSGESGASGAVDGRGGGYPVLNPEQKENASVIIISAAKNGLNPDAAVAGIVAALTGTDLKDKFYLSFNGVPLFGPLTPVGIFGFTPYEWAPQFWSGVEYEGEGWNDRERLRQSVEYLENPENSVELFFRTFNTHRLLANGKWKDRSSWDLAKIVRESRTRDWEASSENSSGIISGAPEGDEEGDEEMDRWFSNTHDNSVYAASAPRAISTLLTLHIENPEWNSQYPEFWNGFTLNNQNIASYYGSGSYTLAPPEMRKFTDGPVIYPKTQEALARAKLFVGNPQFVCGDARFDTGRGAWQGCRAKCDHLAGDIWGYYINSGYWDAKYHWGVALSQGIARPGNRTPPIGSLLFWDTGPLGHVATYIGGGMVVSNLTNGPNGTSIYEVPAEYFENNWGSPYLGWADPVFRGNPAGPGEPGIGLPNKVVCSSHGNGAEPHLNRCLAESNESLRLFMRQFGTK